MLSGTDYSISTELNKTYCRTYTFLRTEMIFLVCLQISNLYIIKENNTNEHHQSNSPVIKRNCISLYTNSNSVSTCVLNLVWLFLLSHLRKRVTLDVLSCLLAKQVFQKHSKLQCYGVLKDFLFHL